MPVASSFRGRCQFVQRPGNAAFPADHPGDMKALILIACALFLGFMAAFYTDGAAHVYAALAAAGSLLLTLK